MIRTIYHGSDHIIEKPVFGLGKVYNDYGRGFYCTEDLNMAKEWGVGKDHDGIANGYEIDCSRLSILNLNDPSYTILYWLTVLLENRTFDTTSALAFQSKEFLIKNYHLDHEKYDCIIGYRADDSYFSFAQDFLNGTISYRQLNNAMHLGKPGTQFVLKSKKAFNALNFIGFETADKTEWYTRKKERDIKARRKYFDVERNRVLPTDIFITQILNEEIRSDDPRLR